MHEKFLVPVPVLIINLQNSKTLATKIFSCTKFFRYRFRNFFGVPNFSDTGSGTFSGTKYFRYRFRDFFPVPIFSDAGSDTTQKNEKFPVPGIHGSGTSHSAVCNLASIAVNAFVDKEAHTFDFEGLKRVAKVATKNQNKIIDVNFCPVEEARKSNMRHRPIGVGVQGLADAYILMRLPFESEEACLLNKQIFETIYYGALEASCELAEVEGPYSTYKGSPVSQGKLQYDLWGVTPTKLHDWAALKAKIARHGIRNSLLLAPMPTASTAQILGNNESVEAYTSNIYSRRVLSGEFQVVNQHLLRDLTELGIWSEELKNEIISANGSVQDIPQIPRDIKALYKTVWEISQKTVLKQAADRGAFIDQSQSLNVHIADPNFGKMSSMHFYGWKLGLKTGMYYLRTKPAAQAIQFTVDKSKIPNVATKVR